MPTRAGLATLACGGLSLGAGRIFGIFELYIVGASMIALVACAIAWTLLHWRSVSVARTVNPQRLHVGAVSTVTLTLSNNGLLPTPVAQITDQVKGERRADAHVPPLGRKRSTRASYGVPAKARGLVEIGPMHTLITDSFGLAAVTRRSAPDTSLLVLPRVDPIDPPPQPGGDLSIRHDRTPGRIGPSGDEFSALRNYAVGDDLRKVHWPSTARTDELMVRTEHVPEYGRSIVLLDVREIASSPDTFERMVSAAASVIAACHGRGDTIRLVTTDGSELVSADDRSFDLMLDHLALLDQSPDTDPRVSLSHAGMGSDTAVLILGAFSDTLIGALRGGPQHGRTTLAVRFGYSGASPTDGARKLRSIRMIDIGDDQEFANRWSQHLSPARSRA